MAPSLGFIGKHDLRIDDKGRLSMPARFRETLRRNFPEDEECVVISVTFDQNLRVQPASEYMKVAGEFDLYSDLDEDARRIKEIVTAFAEEDTLDKGGRIRIPQNLREIAGIDRDVTLVGGLRHFDIWNRENWLRNQAEILENRSELTRRVRESGRPSGGGSSAASS